jgi:hypothetical protein
LPGHGAWSLSKKRAHRKTDFRWNATRDRRDHIPAFEKKDGACRVLVQRDSPKSMFKLLHRTDFCSMFNALPTDQKEVRPRPLAGPLRYLIVIPGNQP